MAASTLGERLGGARRRRFVGRSGEVELFRSAIEASDRATFAVLFVHGPGGVGKSALMARFAEVADEASATPIRIDGRTAEPTPDGFLSAVRTAMHLPPDADPLAELAATQNVVLLVDTYEVLAPIDDWLREQVAPALAADSVVVLAGRDSPPTGWTSDLGWNELLRVISLRNLTPADAHAYLRAAGVPESVHAQVTRVTHGHPLALSLVAEVVRQRGDVPSLEDVPNVVNVLLRTFVDSAPSLLHRDVLVASAVARSTTEAMLRAVVGPEDAPALFDWLRGLSFIEEGRHGLHPHDLARDVLIADLQWRDRTQYTNLRRRIRGHVVDRIRGTTGPEQTRAGTEFVFLHRTNPIVRGFWDWTTAGQAYTDRLRDGDRAAIVAMTERHQGRDQAAVVAYWMDRPAATFFPVRVGSDEPIGYGASVDLHNATDADFAADPGAAAIWEYVHRHGPPRPGERVGVARFCLDRDAGQQQCPSNIAVSARLLRDVLTTSGLSWHFVAAFDDAEYWEPLYVFVDYHRAREAEFTVGGRRYAVFGHDFRRLGVEEWLDMLDEREYGTASVPLTGAAPDVVLSQPDFAEAVRSALRDLHRPDRLTGNPLLRSRVVRQRDTASPVKTLAALVTEATQTLLADPRDAKYHRALERTYMRPAATQERAAEVLGLPFSTYRRHLARGIERVIEVMWRWEIYGTSDIGTLHQPASTLDQQ